MGRVYHTRMGSRVGVGSVSKRKASLGRLVRITMVCGHHTYFKDKVKPKSGEIIHCSLCNDYKEVT